MNSLITDTDIRERLLERPPAEWRLSARAAVERAEAEHAEAERAEADRAAGARTSTGQARHPTFNDIVSASGAIIVVGLGMAFVFVITLVSLGTLPDDQKTAVVTTAFTVLGTIVGAYFGVKVGAAGKGAAEKARDAEAIKVQELAARVDPMTAMTALDSAHRRIRRS
jgi:hypothetical protein